MTRPVVPYLYAIGYLDAIQVQSFDAITQILRSGQLEHKASHVGAIVVSGGQQRLTVPEKASDARDRLRRLFKHMTPIQQRVLALFLQGYQIGEVEKALNLRQRTAKAHLRDALTTTTRIWPQLDRRRCAS
ncbi:MAG: hypothetical protein AAF674_16805 [Pseudomonadota bacterium]